MQESVYCNATRGPNENLMLQVCSNLHPEMKSLNEKYDTGFCLGFLWRCNSLFISIFDFISLLKNAEKSANIFLVIDAG